MHRAGTMTLKLATKNIINCDMDMNIIKNTKNRLTSEPSAHLKLTTSSTHNLARTSNSSPRQQSKVVP